MSTFREPTGELPEWVNASFSDVNGAAMLLIRDPCAMDAALLSVAQAEALLEVLLDICPNAKALAHNWLLEEQKREYMKGGREP